MQQQQTKQIELSMADNDAELDGMIDAVINEDIQRAKNLAKFRTMSKGGIKKDISLLSCLEEEESFMRSIMEKDVIKQRMAVKSKEPSELFMNGTLDGRDPRFVRKEGKEYELKFGKDEAPATSTAAEERIPQEGYDQNTRLLINILQTTSHVTKIPLKKGWEERLSKSQLPKLYESLDTASS